MNKPFPESYNDTALRKNEEREHVGTHLAL